MMGSMMRRAMLGDGSTLSLDFTTGVLDPRLTFTRSTSGTYIGADGLVKTATANTPRFDYDPTSIGTPRGLLIEGSASNLSPYSNLQAAWAGGTNTTLTPNTTEVISPDGTNNAAKIALNSSVYCSRFESITGLAASTAYTFSYWIRGSAGNQQRVYSVTAGTDLVTQTTLSYSTSGWTRVQINFTTTAAVSNVYIYVVSRPTGTASDVIYVWGVQLEAGTGASSLIPTGASAGNRAADKMSMTDISTMQWNQTAGTFALHMDVAAETNTSSFPAFMGMYTATPVRVVRFLLNNSFGTNPRIGNDTWTATPTQILSSLVTRSTAPTAFKFAVSLSNTGQTVNQVFNAGSVTTTSGTGTIQTPTRVLWHQDPSSGDSEYFPIHIRSLKYWPTTLPNAQLQALTT